MLFMRICCQTMNVISQYMPLTHGLWAWQGGTLKLWDVRKCNLLLHSYAKGPSAFAPTPVHTFRELKDGVGGLAVLEGSVISFAGSQVAVASLQPPFETTLSSLISGEVEAGRDTSRIAAAALLPVGRLMLVADDAGYVKVCR